MKLSPEPAITLLHTCRYGTLVTQSATLIGDPFATALAHALDATHNPVLCISALAEHTKNVLADPRVSLSVVQPGADDVQDTVRRTRSFEPPTIGRDSGFDPLLTPAWRTSTPSTTYAT